MLYIHVVHRGMFFRAVGEQNLQEDVVCKINKSIKHQTIFFW